MADKKLPHKMGDAQDAYHGDGPQEGDGWRYDATDRRFELGKLSTISRANKTVYVDQAATGAGDGTSWTDAFTTIQDAVDSLEDIIVHDYTIRVRKGTNPYRETVYLNSDPANHPAKLILGSLSIEGEHYWNANCDNNAVAGDIVDADADFDDVEVGDRVLLLDFNGASSKCQAYEVCTVDDISGAAGGTIGTDGAKTATTGWRYIIVKTKVSGSDDGTDGGTARNYIFHLQTVDNVGIKGLWMDFSDSLAIFYTYCRGMTLNTCIIENCDYGVRAVGMTYLTAQYCFFGVQGWLGLGAGEQSVVGAYYDAYEGGGAASGVHAERSCYVNSRYSYFDNCACAIDARDVSMVTGWHSTIENDCTVGLRATFNSGLDKSNVTNNAGTAESTSDGGVIA